MQTLESKPKLKYEPPILIKQRRMTFPIQIIQVKSGKTTCKQCSSCHACR